MYDWDDPMTSMQCAWYTRYTYLDLDEKAIKSCSPCSGCGQSLKDKLGEYEEVPLTDELKALCRSIKHEEAERKAAKAFEEYSKEVEEYNNLYRPQEKGQIVTITEGKHKGKVGRIVWIGKNSFKRSYGSRYTSWRQAAVLGIINSRPYTIPCKDLDLVLVRPVQYGTTWEDGTEKVYIDIDRCRVTEGFKPIVLTLDDCRRFCDRQSRNWTAYRDGYNRHDYMTF